MGLFGAQRRLPNIDTRSMGILPGDQPDYGMGDFPLGGRPGAQPQKRPGLGTRLLGEGWAGKVGALGALLQGDTGAVSDYHEQQRLPLLQQAQRETEFADWQRRKQWERDNPMPSTADPYRTEDNAGNVWEMGADGQFKPVFVDPNDRTFLQDGQMITVPNRVRAQQQTGGLPTVADEASYNALPPGAQYRDPQGNLRTKGGAASPASPPFAR